MDYQKILSDTPISQDSPGTILRDFDTLLDLIGVEGLETSGKYHLIPMKQLAALNARLCQPISVNLQRPQQKSYPPIQGLYLLFRFSGLAVLTRQGKKTILSVDPQLLTAWQQLNPTERYFTLLETWLLAMDFSLVDSHASRFKNDTLQLCLRFQERLAKGIPQVDRDQLEMLAYIPGLPTLALMRMFGLIELQDAEPGAGEGWAIQSIRPTTFGDAMLARLGQEDMLPTLMDFEVDSDEDFDDPMWFAAKFQGYFQELQNVLELPEETFREGLYTFKVSLPSYCEARFRVPARATLEEFSDAILDMVDFDDDHLHCFYYRNRFGQAVEINHSYMDEGPWTDEQIGDLDLQQGHIMLYVFDFGDHWEFEIELQQIDDLVDGASEEIELLEFQGERPSQYGYEGDEGDEGEEGEDEDEDDDDA